MMSTPIAVEEIDASFDCGGALPQTAAKPVGATIFVVPTRWRETGPLTAELVVKLIETAVIDFYREDKTP